MRRVDYSATDSNTECLQACFKHNNACLKHKIEYLFFAVKLSLGYINNWG